MLKRIPCALAVLLGAALTTGCGGGGGDVPPLGTVTGVVTIDGKPAENVRVRFSPADGGRPSMGTTNNNGEYQLVYSTTEMGAVVGKHSVSIDNPPLDTENIDPRAMEKPAEGSVPAAYIKAKKEIEVKAGSNTIDLTYP